MANAVRVRAELREGRYNDYDDRESAFKKMFTAFKKKCSDAGIMHAYKQHQHHESKSRKRRRKRRESEIQRLKTKLRENFTPPGKRMTQYDQ
jgi:ribosomal protein S21